MALCSGNDSAKKWKSLRQSNIVVILKDDLLDRFLPSIIRIIKNNRRILFQRGIGVHFLENVAAAFKLPNDPVAVTCYSNLICNFLYNANKIDLAEKHNLTVVLSEMLLNAIEHGNCGITYEEKTGWLDQEQSMLDLVEQKCQDPEVAAKRVTFEYSIYPTFSRFLIADEGKGFDWRKDENAQLNKTLRRDMDAASSWLSCTPEI